MVQEEEGGLQINTDTQSCHCTNIRINSLPIMMVSEPITVPKLKVHLISVPFRSVVAFIVSTEVYSACDWFPLAPVLMANKPSQLSLTPSSCEKLECDKIKPSDEQALVKALPRHIVAPSLSPTTVHSYLTVSPSAMHPCPTVLSRGMMNFGEAETRREERQF